MASYTFRKSALTTPETWEVTETGLDYTNNGLTHFKCPYQNISSVRLKYSPSRMKTNNYSCEIEFNPTTVSKVKIPSISYVSFANFEDKATDYKKFVQELTAAIAKVNPNCKFYSGRKMSAILIEAIAVLLMMAFLFFIFSIFAAVMGGFIVIKIIIIIWSLYYIIKGFTINRPGEFNPHQVSEKILPSASS